MKRVLISVAMLVAFASVSYAALTTDTSTFVAGPNATYFATPFNHLPAMNSGPSATTNLLAGKAHTMVNPPYFASMSPARTVQWHHAFGTDAVAGGAADVIFQTTLTNGVFENSGEYSGMSNGLVALAWDDNNDWNGRQWHAPRTIIRYTFATPVDIKQIKMWSGHAGDSGSRARIDCDIKYSKTAVLADWSNLILLPVRAANQQDGGEAGASSDSGIGYLRVRDDADANIATSVVALQFEFWGVGAFGAPKPMLARAEDADGQPGTGVEGAIIKEIEAWGTSPSPVEDWMMF